MRNLINMMLKKSDPFRILLTINLDDRVNANLKFKDRNSKVPTYNLSLRLIHDYLKSFL